MSRSLPETASFVIGKVRELGLEPSSSSRLMQMQSAFVGSHDRIAPDDARFETVLESYRDMQQLEFVFEHVQPESESDEFVRLVRAALKDSVLPQDDRKQSRGRDAQFELYIAAVCNSAKLLPVLHEEPDITCVVDGIKFGIEGGKKGGKGTFYFFFSNRGHLFQPPVNKSRMPPFPPPSHCLSQSALALAQHSIDVGPEQPTITPHTAMVITSVSK